MANYNTTTRVIINEPSVASDSTSGSLAKELNDYLESVDDSKTIRSIHSAQMRDGRIITVIIHDS
jgi:hypothetical protein|tara:strand:+ start:20049 stop:20243 length:195 start_codon:yes stop_codon:yes gene_type:complete